MRPAIILGCGFTGQRVAGLLLDRGYEVVVTTRNPDTLVELRRRGATVLALDALDKVSLQRLRSAPRAAVVLHSIPSLKGPNGLLDPTPALLRALAPARPARMVYLSSTGVYGDALEVDENTSVAPRTERERLRVNAERAVQRFAGSALVLRPAAIYGPGRGVHSAMRAGKFKLLDDGENFVSRIHVEDLAKHAVAAMESELSGAYPVADAEPCRSREIAEYCARLLGLPMPPSVARDALTETRRADRKVNGCAIRALLGVELRYPTYREGIPASL